MYLTYHQSIWDVEISALNKPSNVLDKFRVEKSIKEYRFYYENKCKEWGFNEQELKKYKKGEDVYFSYERFKELINHKSQSWMKTLKEKADKLAMKYIKEFEKNMNYILSLQ